MAFVLLTFREGVEARRFVLYTRNTNNMIDLFDMDNIQKVNLAYNEALQPKKWKQTAARNLRMYQN